MARTLKHYGKKNSSFFRLPYKYLWFSCFFSTLLKRNKLGEVKTNKQTSSMRYTTSVWRVCTFIKSLHHIEVVTEVRQFDDCLNTCVSTVVVWWLHVACYKLASQKWLDLAIWQIYVKQFFFLFNFNLTVLETTLIHSINKI